MARKIDRGASLVELVVALFVLGMMLILLLNLFPTAMASVRQSEQMVQAEALAQSLLEVQRARPYGDLEVGNFPLDPVPYQGVTFEPVLEVFQVDGMDQENLLGLRVTVSWEARQTRRQIEQEVWVANVRH